MNIGLSIKIANAYADTTQANLASLMGVTEQTITNWVKEKTHPKTSDVRRMAIIFNMPVSEFIALGEPKEKG